jgi:hypothetical protein
MRQHFVRAVADEDLLARRPKRRATASFKPALDGSEYLRRPSPAACIAAMAFGDGP